MKSSQGGLFLFLALEAEVAGALVLLGPVVLGAEAVLLRVKLAGEVHLRAALGNLEVMKPVDAVDHHAAGTLDNEVGGGAHCRRVDAALLAAGHLIAFGPGHRHHGVVLFALDGLVIGTVRLLLLRVRNLIILRFLRP